jgi:hypothetical protein
MIEGSCKQTAKLLQECMKRKGLRRRRFKLHWGGGWITEEARSVTQYHEPFDPVVVIRFG